MCSDTMSPRANVETSRRRGAAEEDSNDDNDDDASSLSSASSSSDLSDASEQERLRAFARNFYRRLNTTEKNPSMSKLTIVAVEQSLRVSSTARRPSLFRNLSSDSVASNNNNNNSKKNGSRRELSWTKKSFRQGNHRRSMRQKLRSSIKTFMGKKCVRFLADKRLTSTQLIETIQELDVTAIWFSGLELDEFKADAEDMATALENTPNLHANHPDWRGLENRSEEGNWNAYKARSDCTNAVLDVQDEMIALQQQKRRKNTTPTDGALRMAAASREVSAKGVAQAVERAALDAQIAAQTV